VGRGIADSGCRFSANKYSGLTFNDSVYWPYAYRKITNPSSRLAFYQDGLTTGWNYWTPNMGHKYSYHWANMHITYSCGKRHIAILSNSEALEVPNKSFPNDSSYYDFNSSGLRLKTDY
jgi:hypothetical protein